MGFVVDVKQTPADLQAGHDNTCQEDGIPLTVISSSGTPSAAS